MSSRQNINRTWREFASHYKRPPTSVAYSPGRVNLIGDHTDYNGGLALPAPINRWVHAGVAQTKLDKGPGLRVHSAASGETLEWRREMDAPETTWMRFAQGAYELWSERFGKEAGFDVYVWGDVPQGVGLSSSAALGVALLNGLSAASGTELEAMELCRLAQRIEHEYLGLQSGLLDQMAVVYGKKDALMELDFKDLSMQYHELPQLDVKWVVIDSGVRRELSNSGYQQRVEETRAAMEELGRLNAAVQHPRDVTKQNLEALLYPPDGIPGPESRAAAEEPVGRGFSREALYRRLRHFISENERVRSFIGHLKGGDIWAAGDVMDASHASLRDDYESSCEEVDVLQSEAIRTKGCLGSRIMGGGFGGCTINMVVPERVETFLENVGVRYEAATGLKAKGFAFDWANAAGVQGKL